MAVLKYRGISFTKFRYKVDDTNLFADMVYNIPPQYVISVKPEKLGNHSIDPREAVIFCEFSGFKWWSSGTPEDDGIYFILSAWRMYEWIMFLENKMKYSFEHDVRKYFREQS